MPPAAAAAAALPARVLPVHSTLSTLPPDLELGRKAYKAIISQQTAVQSWRQQLIREPAVIHNPSPSFSVE